jgi:hypothetical protein
MIKFKYKNAPFLLIVFPVIALFIIFFNKPIPENNLNIQFRGKIIKIKKQYRGRYDILLQTNEFGQLEIIDNYFSNHSKKVKTGDSAIKVKNTNCILYKKDTILFENCLNVSIILP